MARPNVNTANVLRVCLAVLTIFALTIVKTNQGTGEPSGVSGKGGYHA